jgi:putative cell wall-binding protein
VAYELERLNPTRIVILGGPAAVSHEVATLAASYQD